MKKKMRMLTAILALFLLMSITGCGGVKDSEGTMLIKPGQKWIQAMEPGGTFSDTGYYAIKGRHFYFLNTTSGEYGALCEKEGCLHADEKDPVAYESCGAYISPNAQWGRHICFWEGYLYYIEMDCKLYRYAPDGTGRTLICDLGTQNANEQRLLNRHVFADGYWYFDSQVSVRHENPDGSFSYSYKDESVIRVNLKTGEEELLADEANRRVYLVAVSDGDVLYETFLRLEKYEMFYGQEPVKVKHYDGQTGRITTLVETTANMINSTPALVNGKVYYLQEKIKIERKYDCYDLITGEQSVTSEIPGGNDIGGGYAIYMDQDTSDRYLFDQKANKRLPYDIEPWIWQVRCTTDRGCVLVDMLQDGYVTEHYREFYVPYAALADGLQESDLIVFDTRSIRWS